MDPYTLLDLPPTAAPDDIRAAYRRRAAEWHPDRQPPEKKAEAVERMVQLNAARDLLLDPRRRIQYHREHENALRWKMAQSTEHTPPPYTGPRRRSWAFIYETQRRRQRQRFYRQLWVSVLALAMFFFAGLLVLFGLAGNSPEVQLQQTAMFAAVALWLSMISSMAGALGLTLLIAFVVAGLGRLFRR
jgi:hypothetical protein